MKTWGESEAYFSFSFVQWNLGEGLNGGVANTVYG